MFGKTRSQSNRQQPRPAFERLDVSDLHFADELPQGGPVALDGRGEAFVRTAAGPEGAATVLLVHGLFATADLNWSLSVPALAKHFNVIAPDLRGHGRGLRTRRFSGEECADDLAAIVRTLGAGRVIVVGYSLGGLVAQVFVRRHPDLVAGLILCATAGRFSTPADRGLPRLAVRAVRRAPESLRRAVMMAALKPRSAGCARGRWMMSEVRRHDTAALLDAISELREFDSSAWLGTTQSPSAVVVMAQDATVPPDAQHELARVLGGSRVYEMEGDHFACVKRPDEFNAILLGACAAMASAVPAA